jgi:hypothetical protein
MLVENKINNAERSFYFYVLEISQVLGDSSSYRRHNILVSEFGNLFEDVWNFDFDGFEGKRKNTNAVFGR